MVSSVNPITETISPFLPIFGTIFGAIVVGIFALWNRKRGNFETRAPDVNQIWQQQARDALDLDLERRWRRRLENFSHELLASFRHYVHRVQDGGDRDLTPYESKIINTDPPTAEIKITETKK